MPEHTFRGAGASDSFEYDPREIEPSERPLMDQILRGLATDPGLGPAPLEVGLVGLANIGKNAPRFIKALEEAVESRMARGENRLSLLDFAKAYAEVRWPSFARASGLGAAEIKDLPEGVLGQNLFRISAEGKKLAGGGISISPRIDTLEEMLEILMHEATHAKDLERVVKGSISTPSGPKPVSRFTLADFDKKYIPAKPSKLNYKAYRAQEVEKSAFKAGKLARRDLVDFVENNIPPTPIRPQPYLQFAIEDPVLDIVDKLARILGLEEVP